MYLSVHDYFEQRGIIGTVVAPLMRRMTQRYLAMEGQGLEARSEGDWKLRGADDP